MCAGKACSTVSQEPATGSNGETLVFKFLISRVNASLRLQNRLKPVVFSATYPLALLQLYADFLVD
jgi:hypothetical protein